MNNTIDYFNPSTSGQHKYNRFLKVRPLFDYFNEKPKLDELMDGVDHFDQYDKISPRPMDTKTKLADAQSAVGVPKLGARNVTLNCMFNALKSTIIIETSKHENHTPPGLEKPLRRLKAF